MNFVLTVIIAFAAGALTLILVSLSVMKIEKAIQAKRYRELQQERIKHRNNFKFVGLDKADDQDLNRVSGK